MKVFRDVIVPAHTNKVVDLIECDLCGKAVQQNTHHGDFDVVTINRESGYSFVDSASFSTTSFDVCPTCFDAKLMPLFASCGATPSITKTDW